MSEAMLTTGVAPRWNQPRNLGGAKAANFSRSLTSLLISQLYGSKTGLALVEVGGSIYLG
jgi:hypothetical protein